MIRKLRFLGAIFLLPWLLMAAMGTRYTEAAPAQQAMTFTVMVGNAIHTEQGEKPSWQGQNFYPGTLTINEGDSITWKFDTGNEPHTVSFLGPITDTASVFSPVAPDPDTPIGPQGPTKFIINPMVGNPQGGTSYDGSAFTSSGMRAADIPAPKEYTLSFPKAGTYDYVCLLHAAPGPDGAIVGMKGTITVQAAGGTRPMTPEQAMAQGKQQQDSDAARAAQLEPQMAGMVKPSETMPDGSTKHHVEVGGMDMERNLEYQRFTPKTLTVKQGDSVEWSMSMPGFHTVTFGEEPELVIIEPQPAGPPKQVINPMFFPAGGAVHTGTGYYNSGPMAGPGSPPEAGVQSYALKFAAPGRFEYICIPHYTLGMDGTIVVEAATGGVPGPGMPTTGSGDALNTALLAALLSLAGIAGGLWLIKERRTA
jgi:plastocyanin